LCQSRLDKIFIIYCIFISLYIVSFEAASEEAGVQYQEKTGLQSQDIGRSEIGSKSIDATCDDDDVAGMILDIANG